MKDKEKANKTYVVVTDDGPGHTGCFLTWSCDMGGYYTTVDYIDEVGEYDLHISIEEAENRARDADSGTLFGWIAPMKIMEVLNFDEAYNKGEEPELLEVKTVVLN